MSLRAPDIRFSSIPPAHALRSFNNHVPLSALLDAPQMSEDILLELCKSLDCVGIKNLAATSRDVRELMNRESFWNALARMKEIDLAPAADESAFHAFFRACVEKEASDAARREAATAELLTAVSLDRYEDAYAALLLGADVNAANDRGRTPLDLLTGYPVTLANLTQNQTKWALVRELAARGGRVTRSEFSQVAKEAAAGLDEEVLRFLVNLKQFELDWRSVSTDYPLGSALNVWLMTGQGSERAIRMLRKLRFKLNSQWLYDRLVSEAQENAEFYDRLVFLALDAAAYKEENLKHRFFKAVKKDDGDAIRLLSDLGVDVEQETAGHPAIVLASYLGNFHAVDAILESGSVDVNVTNTFQQSALTVAAAENHESVVQRLLRVPDIKPNELDGYKLNALAHAVRKGNVSIVRMLLNHRAIDANATFSAKHAGSSQRCLPQEQTALIIAVLYKNVDVVKEFLRHENVDVNKGGHIGVTPLMYAVWHNNVSIVELLVDSPRIDVNRKTTRFEVSAKTVAVARKRTQLYRLLGISEDESTRLYNDSVFRNAKVLLETCKFEDFERAHRLEVVVDGQRVVHTQRRPVVRRQLDR